MVLMAYKVDVVDVVVADSLEILEMLEYLVALAPMEGPENKVPLDQG